MKLTKDDIDIIRWAFNTVMEQTLDDPSGDLFAEEREGMRRALRNLPAKRALPAGPPLGDYTHLQRQDNKDLRRLMAKRLKKHPNLNVWPAHWPRP